jgi:hypothetical protein
MVQNVLFKKGLKPLISINNEIGQVLTALKNIPGGLIYIEYLKIISSETFIPRPLLISIIT